MRIPLKELSAEELSCFIKGIGEPGYRSIQISEWLYRKGAVTFDEMTNLSLGLRDRLKKSAYIDMPAIAAEQKSSDGTIKYQLRLTDGYYIESVLMKDKDRLTMCLSAQAGCRFGCIFCLTGKYGWKRNLLQSEIVDQALLIKRKNNIASNKRINIVLMGMGEPLDNYSNVLKAIRTISSESGMGISPRRITLSTCGLIPQMKKLSKEGLGINLAVSLNAASDNIRTYIMPINRTCPVKDVITACRNYPLAKRSRITIEYIMLSGINDSELEAKRLAGMLRGIRCKINLIPFNSINFNNIKPASIEQIYKFQDILKSRNYTATIRKSKGRDIMAACGQLGAINNDS